MTGFGLILADLLAGTRVPEPSNPVDAEVATQPAAF